MSNNPVNDTGMKKRRAALLSVGSNTLLIIVKIAAGIISGSISIISEALHSLMDLVASAIAYYSVRQASLPPDEDHPFGHGKMENLSGLFESLLLLGASVFIIYEAISRTIDGSMIKFPVVALGVMGFSACVNILISRYLYKVARETDSIALEADAKHLSADVYTSAGVFAGLLLVMVTGFTILDSIIAVLVALYIAYEGFVLTRKSIAGLMDTRLPDDEVEVIRQVLDEYAGKMKYYHDLRTRKAGSERHVDFHMVLCREAKIADTHTIMEQIEKELQRVFPETTVLMRPEPCIHFSDQCPTHCHWEEGKRVS